MEIGRCFVCFATILFIVYTVVESRSFTIDYDNNTFLKDGQPFHYVSGSIHYSRVPHYYWEDRLKKMYAAGLDAIQVYVPWNVHEPQPGKFDFEGQQDLPKFLKIAQEVGLLVILRAGPYICGEWEYGGFPAWLIKNNGSMVVRSTDPQFLGPVDSYFATLLPLVKTFLYSNGGPIIMVQVENEFGSYRKAPNCDDAYLEHLTQTFRKYLADDVILFTTDGAAPVFLKCGPHKGLFTTVDFGPGNVTQNFQCLIDYRPKGPLVNSEYYTGWLDYWGGGHSTRDKDTVVKYLKDMIDMKASVSMYMFEGGTSFGYMNGADPPFQVCPTSYDYDGPLSEAGDPTDKYYAIRNLMSQYKPNLPPVPPATPKYSYGDVKMQFVSTVLEALPMIQVKEVNSVLPLSMEQVDQSYGFILYRTILKQTYPTVRLNVSGIRDRAHVLLNSQPIGILDRTEAIDMNLIGRKGDVLAFLVENQGRINFGQEINNNRKGIIANVTTNNKYVLTDWIITPLNFTKLFDNENYLQSTTLKFMPHGNGLPCPDCPIQPPSIYSGVFTLPNNSDQPQDTFLKMAGWFKGQAFINGFNVGRYWPIKGPQVTLFVPKGVLLPYPARNTIVMIELESAPCGAKSKPPGCVVQFVDKPIINGTATVGLTNEDIVKYKMQGFKQWQKN